MNETKLTFKRYEKKYLLTPDEYARIRARLDAYIEPDEFFSSTVCSVYYDTEDFEFIRRSIDAPVYKEKLRLRSYNVPSAEDGVFLELKRKFKGLVYKRRVMLPEADARRYLAGELPSPGGGQIMHELDWFLANNDVKARVFIACDREAYRARDDAELRITFDKSIRWRQTELELTVGSHGEELLPPGYVLMEIKMPDAAPMWLAHMLSEDGLFPRGFSKYGETYKNKIADGVIFSV